MNEWYYVKDGSQQSPIAFDELKSLLASKTIDPNTLVWKTGMPEWKPADQTPELSSPTPPAVPGVTSAAPTSDLPLIPSPAEPLDISAIFNEAFALFKTDWLNLSLAVLIFAVLQVVPGRIPYIGFLIQLAIGGALMLGYWKFLLAKVDGQPLPLGSLFSCFDQWFPAAVVSLLTGIIVVIGMILLIIPGIIAIALLSFWPALVVDKKIGVFDSLGASVNLAKPHLFNLFLLILLSLVICLVGFICLIVGIFPAAALAWLLLAVAYRKLSPKDL